MMCSVCFGDPTSPITQGYNFGILSLLAVISFVLFIFALFFINIFKRAASSTADTLSNLQ